MKYRQLWTLCEQCLESFELLPPNSVLTIDDHIEETLNQYNSKIEHDMNRQATLQASSAKQASAADTLNSEAWKAKTLALMVQPDETIFFRETVRGVYANKAMLTLAFKAYAEGKKRNKQDSLALTIVMYLLLFRYEELGPEAFRQLIDHCAPYAKLAEFIGFFLDRHMLDQYAVPKWRSNFDDVYVEEVLVGSLLAIKENVEAYVLNWLLAKGTNVAQAEAERQASLSAQLGLQSGSVKKSKKPTEPKSPQLTKPGGTQSARGQSRVSRPDELLPPFEIREMIHLEPLPKLPRIPDRATTPEKQAVAAAKFGEKRSTLKPDVVKENRKKEAAIQFRSFSATQRPTNLPKLLEEQREREQKEREPLFPSRPSPLKVRKMLEEITDQVEVKTTTATLLREEVLYAKRREEEELALKRKTKELHDDSEYQEWKRKAEEQDEVNRLAAIAQRKLDMMLVDEEAKAAKLRQQKHNLHISRQFRKEAEIHKKEQEKETAKKEAMLHARAKEIRAETEEIAKNVKKEVAAANAKIVKEQLEIKQQNEMKVAVALELERERKQDMIRRIKEVHAASVAMQQEAREKRKSVRPVDLGELVSMTYDELQEKLRQVKEEHDELVEQRRQKIVSMRSQEKEERSQMAERILSERKRMQEMKAMERERRREAQAQIEAKAKAQEETQLIELQAKLQATREERIQVQKQRKEEDRQRRLAAQLLSADANAVEKEKWEEMLRGFSNRLVSVQNNRLEDQAVDRKRDAGITQLREHNIEDAHQTRMATLHERDDEFERRKQRSQADALYDENVRLEATNRMKEDKKRRTLMASQW